MSTFKDAGRKIDAFVGSLMHGIDGMDKGRWRLITGSMSGIIPRCFLSAESIGRMCLLGIGLVMLGCMNSHARVSSPGNVTFSSPDSLNTSAIFDSTGTFVLQMIASDGVKSTSATVTIVVNSSIALPRIIGGSAPGIAGTAWDVPLSFIQGSTAVSGLQFDLVLPVGVTVASVTTGPAALAASKSIATNLLTGNYRILVFGMNQTAIGSGVLATVSLRTDAGLSTGSVAIPIINVVASDAAGTAVPPGTSGAITLSVTANKAPVVTLGPNQTITGTTANLTATASDDNAPTPPGKLTFQWSVL